jgi:hypothetical protein
VKVRAVSGGYTPNVVSRLDPSRLPLLCLLGAAWGMVSASRAQACPIEVVGPESARWQGAAATTTAALSNDAEQRCASVIVETTPSGAVLRLATRDGRLATRELHEPVELLPAVQALTEPALDSSSGEPPERHTKPDSAAVAKPRPKVERTEPERRALKDPYATRPLLGLVVGFRLGADRLITPTVGGSLSLLQPPLELGILARFEAHYVASTGGNEKRPETSGLAFGAQLGVHRPLDNVALRGGLLLLVVALREDEGAQRGRAEARFGGYFGAVWPSHSKLRLRSDIALDLVPYNIGRSETNALGESSLPWWGFSLSLGVEVG